MSSIRTDRLMRLTDLLDTIEPEAFDLEFWKRSGPNCGTTACAIGHACTIPEFIEAGLQLHVDVQEEEETTYFVAYKNYISSSAVMEFFGLDYNQAMWLFYPLSYEDKDLRNPKKVATRIRKFLNDGCCRRRSVSPS